MDDELDDKEIILGEDEFDTEGELDEEDPDSIFNHGFSPVEPEIEPEKDF